jgi:hypothetical protein
MNSIKSVAILFFALFSPTIFAQESFLQLDSIVVIEDELNFSTFSGAYNIGRDTIDIIVGSNQYVKLRKVSFSMRSTAPVFFAGEYIDMSIGTTTNLYLDLASSMLKWTSVSLSSASNFRSDYLDPKSIKLETFPDEFLTETQEVFVKYDNRSQPNVDVYYRLELVYFSYE